MHIIRLSVSALLFTVLTVQTGKYSFHISPGDLTNLKFHTYDVKPKLNNLTYQPTYLCYSMYSITITCGQNYKRQHTTLMSAEIRQNTLTWQLLPLPNNRVVLYLLRGYSLPNRAFSKVNSDLRMRKASLRS